MKKNILLLISSILLSFLLLEIGLRIGGYLYLKTHGWKDKQRLPEKKSYTILCIGESTTFGAGVSKEYSYPSWLERILNEKGVGAEVMNLGKPTKLSGYIADRLEAEISLYSPDLVIAMMGINDVMDPRTYSVFAQKNFLSRHLRSYKLIKLLYFSLKDKIISLGDKEMQASGDSYEDLLDDAFAFYYEEGDIQAAKRALLLAQQIDPLRGNAPNLLERIYNDEGKTYKNVLPYTNLKKNYNKVRYLCAKNNVAFIAMAYPLRELRALKEIFTKPIDDIIFVSNEKIFREALNEYSYKELFTDEFGGEFGHCTSRGNKLIAENLAEIIIKSIIPKTKAGLSSGS